jgi:hypothetical protein
VLKICCRKSRTARMAQNPVVAGRAAGSTRRGGGGCMAPLCEGWREKVVQV